MNVASFISKRYLFSKGNRQAINIISWISVVAIVASTMSLVIVLSVFNGFQSLIGNLYSDFDSDFLIQTKTGRYFEPQAAQLNKIKNVNGIDYCGEVIEESALLKFSEKQFYGTIKGISREQLNKTKIASHLIYKGQNLERGNFSEAILGQGIAATLSVEPENPFQALVMYTPNQNSSLNSRPEELLNTRQIGIGGVFSLQQEFDSKYVLVPLELSREITGKEKEVTSLEVFVSNHADEQKVQKELQEILGDKFTVKNKYQQHEFVFKIMQAEKWAVFFILSFIIVIAAFNITGSTTMLIIEKQKDIRIFKSLGMTLPAIKNIFAFNGFRITLIGSSIGLILGLLICLAQIKFGLIKLSGSESFIIKYYPVQINLLDLMAVFFTVVVIGWISSRIPIRGIK
jgi:lipoprotein-releasing system permease protein